MYVWRVELWVRERGIGEAKTWCEDRWEVFLLRDPGNTLGLKLIEMIIEMEGQSSVDWWGNYSHIELRRADECV